MILQLKALGVDNVLRFPFVSPPAAVSMSRSLEYLYALAALDDNCQLTDPLGSISSVFPSNMPDKQVADLYYSYSTGLQLAEFPLEPAQAQVLLQSGKHQCSEEILSIIALMQVTLMIFLSSCPACCYHH